MPVGWCEQISSKCYVSGEILSPTVRGSGNSGAPLPWDGSSVLSPAVTSVKDQRSLELHSYSSLHILWRGGEIRSCEIEKLLKSRICKLGVILVILLYSDASINEYCGGCSFKNRFLSTCQFLFLLRSLSLSLWGQ